MKKTKTLLLLLIPLILIGVLVYLFFFKPRNYCTIKDPKFGVQKFYEFEKHPLPYKDCECRGWSDGYKRARWVCN